MKDETVASLKLRFLERTFRLGNHLLRRAAGPGKQDAADGGREVDLRLGGLDRLLPDGLEDPLRRARELARRGLREHNAERVGVEPADDVAGAEAAIEPLADGDEGGVAGLMTEGVVDHRKLVEPDDEEATRQIEALAIGQGVFERVAQPYLVEMTGQLVEVGEPFEARFVLLAGCDQAKAADQALRQPAGRELRLSAVVDPGAAAAVRADAVLAVIGGSVGEMIGQRLEPDRQIFGMDASAESGAARNRGQGDLAEDAAGPPGPENHVPDEIPFIDKVAGRLDGAPHPVGP